MRYGEPILPDKEISTLCKQISHLFRKRQSTMFLLEKRLMKMVLHHARNCGADHYGQCKHKNGEFDPCNDRETTPTCSVYPNFCPHPNSVERPRERSVVSHVILGLDLEV